MATAQTIDPKSPVGSVWRGLTLFRDQESWHEFRRRHIGASEVAAVLDEDAFAGPHNVFTRKVLGDTDRAGTIRMRQGLALEPLNVEEFQRVMPFTVFRDGRAMAREHPTLPILSATPDALLEADGSAGVLELKWTSEHRLREQPGSPLFEHVLQVQAQLSVLGLDWGYLSALTETDHHIWRIERDDKLIAIILEAVQDFWERHVKTGTPPKPNGSRGCRDLLARVYTDHEGDLVLSEEAVGWAVELEKIKARMKADDMRADELKNLLYDHIGPHSRGLFKDGPHEAAGGILGYKVSKIQRRGNLTCETDQKEALQQAGIPFKESAGSEFLRMDTVNPKKK